MDTEQHWLFLDRKISAADLTLHRLHLHLGDILYFGHALLLSNVRPQYTGDRPLLVRHSPPTQDRIDAPKTHQSPGAFKEDKAELTVHDRNHHKHGRSEQVDYRVPQVGGLDPTGQDGRVGCE